MQIKRFKSISDFTICVELDCVVGVQRLPALHYIIGYRCKKTCLRWFANNKGTDQPAYLRSLISAFVIYAVEGIKSKLDTSDISVF